MSVVAKLFRNGGSQAVRIPKDFRFDGEEVTIEQTPAGLLLKPVVKDEWQWLGELQRLADEAGPFPDSDSQEQTPDLKPEVAEFFK
jgi:antitoxin VapB